VNELNVMDKAERLTNVVHEKLNLQYNDYVEIRQAIILELGEIKKEESKETAISSNSEQIIQDDCSTKSFIKQELRSEAEKLMLKIGFNASIKGFKYIVDIMELFYDNDWFGKPMERIYEEVARINNTSRTNVFHVIEYSFVKCLSNGNIEMVQKYLLLEYPTIKELIYTLWRSLQQEIGEKNNGE
jgi:hypothetical protein